MLLSDADPESDYIISDITCSDEELSSFLFSLGCYSGEKITLISKKKSTLIIGVKDAVYCIDMDLASAIEVEKSG